MGTVQNGTDKLKLDFEYGTLNTGTGQVINGTNNGNVAKQTMTVPTETRNNVTYGSFSATQYYTYDALNRIKIAGENLTPNGQSTYQSWMQTFQYDRYGNRQFNEANTTTLPKNCGTSPNFTVCTADKKILNPSVNTSNNRLSTNDDYAFDNAGNTTQDAIGRTFIYDAENKQVEVKDSQNQTIGQYFYDGDGKRVKKISNTETTVFIYNAGGQLVAEYSTQVASQQDAKVSYLTTDHLGSPRINTDANGAVIARHDYQPFGEEITRASYGADMVRKQFATYERDKETDLDFAQARYHNFSLGRFNSPDPLYFQLSMVIDPQRFNLYGYALNNPLKWLDPNGEEVITRGARTINAFYEMVGGQEMFDQYFTVTDGQVVLRPDIDLSQANSGVQFLAELVNASENYLFYFGNDFNEIADLFKGAVDDDGDLTSVGKLLREEFEGSSRRATNVGKLISVRGRETTQPLTINGNPLFAVIAYNSDALVAQSGISRRHMEMKNGSFEPIEKESQLDGLYGKISAASYFIHEGAEAETFSRIGVFDSYTGEANYRRAHQSAMRREAQIRRDLGLTGGFAGGSEETIISPYRR